ncbi:MAG: hypothetical protein H7834_11295 [Magnetococcus sp. YQC-9]
MISRSPFHTATMLENRHLPQGRVQNAGFVSKKAETKPAKAARGAFFAKGAKNASFEERANVKVKGKTLGDKSPRPSLFF